MTQRNLTRRSFLRAGTATALGFAGLRAHFAGGLARGQITDLAQLAADGYGPLVPDPHRIMDLPEGFTYRVISREGERMSDGLRVPGNFDGSAAFAGPDGRIILVRNHELLPEDRARGPFGARNELLQNVDSAKVFERGSGRRPGVGGTTTLVYDTRTGTVEKQFLSLAGTIRNCAGGPTPWGSWITCEETVLRATEGLEQDHGYNFDVPASAEMGLVTPVPLNAMGRMNHEAVAVDPRSGVVYQTEDREDGLIYRFIPTTPGRLAAGGRLQALVIADARSLDTRNWETTAVRVGQRLAVSWMDMNEVESPRDDLRARGFTAGAARFARGEGMWYGNDSVYFACTNGGKRKKGQIFRYFPSIYEGTARESERPGMLELFVEPPDGTLVESADNLTVAPWGDLMIAEDGVGAEAAEVQHLVGVTPQGRLYRFGRNTQNSTELTGVTFSPDGTTLFVNLYNPGGTLAITGPWNRRVLT